MSSPRFNDDNIQMLHFKSSQSEDMPFEIFTIEVRDHYLS